MGFLSQFNQHQQQPTIQLDGVMQQAHTLAAQNGGAQAVIEQLANNGAVCTMPSGKQIAVSDIVKDLAMAEYYCTVADSMTDSMGYTQPMGRSGSMPGGTGGSRRGYGSSGTMGHTDPTEIIRNMLASLSPEMRDQLVKEFM